MDVVEGIGDLGSVAGESTVDDSNQWIYVCWRKSAYGRWRDMSWMKRVVPGAKSSYTALATLISFVAISVYVSG